MKCPTPCPVCDEIVELHEMREARRHGGSMQLVCSDCADEIYQANFLEDFPLEGPDVLPDLEDDHD